jgi:hypothetical protein
MKQVILVAIMAVVAVTAWRIGTQLSSDAISMAVGVMFGVLAGVPTALLVLASSRRRGSDREDEHEAFQRHGVQRGQYGGYYPQPPVIVVTGAPHNAQSHADQPYRSLPAPHDISVDAREFKVVGEREEWIDEW